MNPISLLNSLAFAVVLIGLYVFVVRKRSIGRDAHLLFVALLALTLFRNFSNVLEWSGITATVGRYEEYVEILSPLCWVFFFYAFIRHKAEADLRESEDRYKTLVENSPTCIYIRQGDRFRFLNSRMMEVTGYSREELLSMSIFALVHPDDRDLARRDAMLRDSGQRSERILQYRIVAKDGGILWAETFGGIQVEFEGEPAVLSSFLEISARRRAEQQLKESEERYRILVENSLTGVYILQGDRFQFVSSRLAELLGYTREELMALPVEQVIHSEDLELVQELTRKRMAGAPPFRPQMRVVTQAGRTRWVQIFGSVIEYQGKPAMLGNLIDITEQKKAEEERRNLEKQLQHTQKLESLGVLAGGIAHDFNNLLTSILGHADLAGMTLPPASPAQENLKEIQTASMRAAELCSQMLAYSGRGRFLIEAISLNDAVEEMAHLLGISISKKAALKYNFAKNLPLIEADATQIRQVIMNLITNASEAVGEQGGVISISTGAMQCDGEYLRKAYLNENIEAGLYVYLEVSDSGEGMDAETMDKIFDPFFSTKFTGRGLGLAAVQGIVRGHGGAIKVYSEPGRGSTFTVLFPAADPPARASKKEATAASDWTGSGAVLLVDDEEIVRAVGKSMLEKMGFDVITADDGRDAIEKFRKHADKIKVLLLDLTMPHMDGEETYREIRRIKDDARVILSSGYSEQDATSGFTGKGLAGFVQKPYHYQTLIEIIRSALGE